MCIDYKLAGSSGGVSGVLCDIFFFKYVVYGLLSRKKVMSYETF